MNDFEIKTFKDKTDLYEKYFSFGYTLNEDLSDKLKLIHLICLVTFKMRNSEPNITCREVLERILKINLDTRIEGISDYYQTLAIICQDLLYGIKNVDTLGYTNPKDIINDIKKLLENWLPF
jgi:hypothetical protein